MTASMATATTQRMPGFFATDRLRTTRDQWERTGSARRTWSASATHIALSLCANVLAILLRFDGSIPDGLTRPWMIGLPVLLVLRTAAFAVFHLNDGLWRYTSLSDVRRIAGAIAVSGLTFYVVASTVLPQPYPGSVHIVDAALLAILVTGTRISRRIRTENRKRGTDRRVLVIGAGNAGESIVRDMLKNPEYGSLPVGFVDDDARKVGRAIHGVPVLGTRADIRHLADRVQPDELLIAIPSQTPEGIRSITESLQELRLPIVTLPSLRDLVQRNVTVSQIRPLVIEDLLPRAPIGLDLEPARALIAGRHILITGAGGSIGSELSRQIAALEPARLALVDRYENGLHDIALELKDHLPNLAVVPYLVDVTDAARLSATFEAERPSIVFHAAAHKHVPMVEMNPSEGFKNNVLGTKTVADLSQQWGVTRFVFVSTDKAVNPTSVMGATKRLAESYVQTRDPNGPTVFCAVRFGNVLGSNGSVVPRFLGQIRAGGPVTVTHPDVKRYFMLIREAVQLLLLAAAHAGPGQTYILEMGDQIRLADLARNLIRLMGHEPDTDIPIRFVGLRPGEKLSEELVAAGETATPGPIAGIQKIESHATPDGHDLAARINTAIAAAMAAHDQDVVSHLKQLVPTYTGPAVQQTHRSEGTAELAIRH